MRFSLYLLACIAVTWIVAAGPSVFVVSGPGEWYQSLQKPPWNPPSWLFGPVWSLLYTLMGIAAWLVWRRALQASVGVPLILYGIQLLLNATWSPIFFGQHAIGLALVNIGLMWVTIVATTIAFWRVNPTAGILFLPYLAWVSFASVLNYTLWWLN